MEKSFMDPVHGFIVIDEPWLLEIVDAPEFQRLRRIRQLGVSSGTYHGAEHTRFGHCLGAFHIMKRVLHQLASRGAAITEEQRRAALAAALLHDVGHGPFSHALEGLLGAMPHESWSEAVVTGPTRIAAVLQTVDNDLPRRVAELIRGRHEAVWLSQLVASQLDVDRFDYLLRDSLYTGTGYGRFDLERVIHTLHVVQGRLVLEVKGLHAAEEYVLARHFMYWRVYLHKTIRAQERMLRSVFGRARELWEAGEKVPAVPEPLALLWGEEEAGEQERLAAYLALDDVDIMSALKAWRRAKDGILADLSRRILDRDLLKPLYPQPVRRVDPVVVEKAREMTKGAGWDPRYYCLLDEAANTPYDAYKEEASPGNSRCAQEPIRVWTGGEETYGLAEMSPLIRSLAGRPQEAANVYVPGPVRERLADELSIRR